MCKTEMLLFLGFPTFECFQFRVKIFQCHNSIYILALRCQFQAIYV